MSTPLEIIVKGNVSEATTGLKSVQAELGKTVMAAQKTDSSLQRLGSSGSQSLALLNTRLIVLKEAMFNEHDISKIAGFNKQIQSTEKEISRLENAGKKGFNELGEAITKSTGAPLTKAFSAVRMLANILPGIGIAGLIGFAAGPIIEFAESLFKAADAGKKYRDIVADTSVEYVKAVTNVQTLTSEIQLAKDGFISKDSVVKHYNETIGKTTGLVNNINQAEAELIKNGAAYIEMTLQKAIGEKAFAAAAKTAYDIKKTSLAVERMTNDEYSHFLLTDQASDRVKNQQDFNDALAIGNEAQKRAAEIASQFKFNIFDDTKTEKAKVVKKEVETISSVLAKMRAEIEVLNKNEIAFGTNEAMAKVKLLQSTITELFKKFKLDPENKLIVQLGFEADDIKERERIRKIGPELIPKDFSIALPLTVAPLKPEEIKKTFATVATEIDKMNQQMADNLKTNLTSALSGLGESIGKVISGGGDLGQAIFGNLFTVLADGLKQLGESMIALGTAKIAIEKFKFAPGIGTVLAGIATVALAALLQAAIPKFAGGVTNFSGGVALVGERGPELVTLPRGSNVIPNNQLSGTGGGQQVFIPAITFRGADMLIMFQRAQAQSRRNG